MQFDQTYRLLFEAVQTESIDAVREAASRIFGSAVSVTDNSFRVLSADADPGSTDDMLETDGKNTYVSGELLNLFREHDLIASLTARPHETIVVDWGYFADHPHITTGIFWQDHILGSVTVLVESADYTKEQDKALQACANALALVIHTREAGRKKLQTERDNFISRLFHGFASPNDLANAVKNHYFRPGSHYVVMATEFASSSISEKANEDDPSLLIYQKDGVSYLLANSQSTNLKKLVDWVKDRGQRFGMSYTFNDLLLTSRMAKQAEAVLRYGNRTGQKKAEWYFSEHALEMLIANTSEPPAHFMHPGLIELSQYDSANNTEYLHTLKIWLQEKMDYTAAAGAMHLHRNSLYYRMQRIRDLFNIDIDDMNTLVQLYLTLCVNKF